MTKLPSRINVQLDERHAVKLHPLEEAAPDPGSIVDLLDAVPGAFERAQRGLREVRSGQGIPLADI